MDSPTCKTHSPEAVAHFAPVSSNISLSQWFLKSGNYRRRTKLPCGAHQVVLGVVVYHIGFKKISLWLNEEKHRKPND
jgi:hypothetical protein